MQMVRPPCVTLGVQGRAARDGDVAPRVPEPDRRRDAQRPLGPRQRAGLLLEVLARENEQLLERQRALYAAPCSLSEKWRIACDLLDEDLETGYVRVLWELWSAGLADPELAAGWRDATAGWRDLLAAVFESWSEQHEVELPVRPRALASLVANLFQGIEIELLAGVSDADAPHREVLDALGALIERAEAS
jgi:hypothetical protein